MGLATIEGRSVHVDGEGFLTIYDEWDELLARARRRPLRRVTTVGVSPTKRLFELFPKKPARKMAYVAGLPKPVGCV